MYYWLRLARTAIEDWKARSITKPRNILPADGEAAATLRYVRRKACRDSGVRNCSVWREGELSYSLETNPCTQCKTMGIGLQEFSEALWGIKNSGRGAGELVVDESDLRGWMNGREPIPPHRLRSAVTKAWMRGWVNSSQAISVASSIADHEAAGSSARHLLRRLRRGKELGNPESLGSCCEAELDILTRAAMERQTHVPDLLDNAISITTLNHVQSNLLQICSTKDAKSC